MNNRNKTVNITILKRFALEKLPESSILRESILLENDEIEVKEFLGKLDVWLFLFKKENG